MTVIIPMKFPRLAIVVVLTLRRCNQGGQTQRLRKVDPLERRGTDYVRAGTYHQEFGDELASE